MPLSDVPAVDAIVPPAIVPPFRVRVPPVWLRVRPRFSRPPLLTVNAPPERFSGPFTVSTPEATDVVATFSVPALIASVPPIVSEAEAPSSLRVAFALESVSEDAAPAESTVTA